MNDDLRAAIANDFLSIIEDLILAGALDHLVLERISMITGCGVRHRAPRPQAQRRRPYVPR